MPAERYFIDCSLAAGSTCKLTGTEFHHLARVMRARKGEQVELVNGKGELASATVERIEKDFALLNVHALLKKETDQCRIILAQAIPRPNHLDFILEKGTELGVNRFWLFPGEGSVKKILLPHQIERARLLTIAAMKQCGRLTLPTVEFKPPLIEWSSLKDLLPFFGDVEPDAPPLENFMKEIRESAIPILFFTGPESGFSPSEVSTLKNLGAKGVQLHSNILRTETASLAALSLISHWQL